MTPSYRADHVTSAFNEQRLTEIFENHIISSTTRGLDGQTPAALMTNHPNFIERISDRLTTRETHPFSPYRQVLKSKGANKPPRIISVPSVADRLVLKAIGLYLSDLLPEQRPEIPQKKVARIKREMETDNGFDYFLKLDIENFYPSIPHDRLRHQLQTLGADPFIVDLIMSALRVQTRPPGRKPNLAPPGLTCGVPQGLSISNILAEIYMSTIDAQIRNIPSVWYERYVDDIIILCNVMNNQLVEDVSIGKLRRMGLTAHKTDDISKRDSGELSKGFTFLGYLFKGTTVSVRQSSIDSLYSALSRVFTQYKYALKKRKPYIRKDKWDLNCKTILVWRLNLHIEGCILNSQRRGWVNYFSQLTDLSILGRLDSFVSRQLGSLDINNDFRSEISPLGIPKFKDAHWRARYPKSRNDNWIQNFDEISRDLKIEILHTVFFYRKLILTGMVSDDLNSLFKKRIQGAVDELEISVDSGY